MVYLHSVVEEFIFRLCIEEGASGKPTSNDFCNATLIYFSSAGCFLKFQHMNV